MKLSELQSYKKIVLVGYGKEGHATEAFLKKFVPNVEIGIADASESPDYLKKLVDYDLAIKSPGVQKSLINIPYTTATNIFFANTSNMIIGITGTKGKSTTTSLIYEILKTAGKNVSLVGNIGNPMLGELMDSVDSDKIFVTELSSYQLDDIQYSPHISVVINLYPEHMNYHGSVEAYYNAKKNILNKATAEDFFVYNPRFTELQSWARDTNATAVPYIEELPFDFGKMQLRGEHNHENAKAAATVAQILKIDAQTVESALTSFKPLHHRLELVGTFKSITFYDDANAAVPEATIAAIKAIPNVGTIFLGGQDRGYNFQSLVDILKETNIPNLVLFPDTGSIIKQLVEKKSDYKPTIFETKEMKDAVQFAYDHTEQGKAVLLSMASPSYSLWKNFEVKGDLFQQCVKELG